MLRSETMLSESSSYRIIIAHNIIIKTLNHEIMKLIDHVINRQHTDLTQTNHLPIEVLTRRLTASSTPTSSCTTMDTASGFLWGSSFPPAPSTSSGFPLTTSTAR